jgi:hypothetical protein
VWWFDTVDDAAHLPQLPGRFRPEMQAAGGRSHSATARRYAGKGRLLAAGSETDFERWEYRDYSELLEIRFGLSGVAIRIEGWGLDADEVLGFAARLQRLELGSQLLKSMTNAAVSATSAWQSWFDERHRHSELTPDRRPEAAASKRVSSRPQRGWDNDVAS